MARTRSARRLLPLRSTAAACALLSALAALLPAVAEAANGQGGSTRASDALAARELSVGAPVVRVYRSEDAQGRVVFGDRPEPGARSVEVRSFVSSSDAQARETALRQQAYWRAQAAGIDERRKAREEAEQQALEQARRADELRPLVLVVPRPLRAPWIRVPVVPPPVEGFAPVYPSSPGAAAGTPAAFIGSGFSTAR